MSRIAAQNSILVPKLATPQRNRGYYGGELEHHELSYWPPTLVEDGKIEMLVRHHLPERTFDMQPELVQEMSLTVEACANPEIARYYAAIGIIVVDQITPSVSLQEATIPPAHVARQRLLELGCINTRIFDGSNYPDMQFFNDIQAPHDPGPSMALRGRAAAHDLLGHIAPAWALLPPQALQAIGEATSLALDAGENPSDLLYKYDQQISVVTYGDDVLSALRHEREIGRGENGYWINASDRINGLTGIPALTPQSVAAHVHGVLDAAREVVDNYS